MRKFILAIIILALAFPVFPAGAENVELLIEPGVNIGVLAGSDAGNKPSFEILLPIDSIPSGAIIQSAKITYAQTGLSGGLLRIIDKYSADVIDSKALSAVGNQEITAILPYVRKWFTTPSQNFGLLFQASALAPGDYVVLGQINIIVFYSFPDQTPPSVSGDIKVETGASTAVITLFTDEPTLVNLEYGRTSQYGTTYQTDNTEPSLGHLIELQNLSSGSTYHYRFTITDAGGNDVLSPDATFETMVDFDITNSRPVSQSLKSPQEFSAEMVFQNNRASASLSWNKSNESGIDGYIIYRADSQSKKFEEYATIESGDNAFLDYEVELGTSYTYYVRSFSDTEISPKSEEKSLTFPSTIPGSAAELPPTTETFLFILAAASVILFGFYVIYKVGQRAEEANAKRLKNVLKDPNRYF